MTTPDPLLAAGTATLAGDDTNPAPVLAPPSLHSTRSWLCTALGEPLPDRDRDSEFRVAEDDPEALLKLFDETAAQCTALFDSPRDVDWSAIRKTHTRPDASDEIQVPAAWALLHAIEHVREHLGQMQLTQQLWKTRR